MAANPPEQNDIPELLALEYNFIDMEYTKTERIYNANNTETVLFANHNGGTNILITYDPAEF